MNETEPKYFTEFRKEFNKRFDSHDEQIAKLSEDVTGINKRLDGMTEEITGINQRLDTHFGQIAANAVDHTETHERLQRLEDRVFA